MNISALRDASYLSESWGKKLFLFFFFNLTDGNSYFAETVIDIQIIVYF